MCGNEIIDIKRKEEDGGGVGGQGVHQGISARKHQEYTFRHGSTGRTPAENGQEYLTSRKEYTDPRKTQ